MELSIEELNKRFGSPFMKPSRQVTASLILQPLTAMNPPLAKL